MNLRWLFVSQLYQNAVKTKTRGGTKQSNKKELQKFM